MRPFTSYGVTVNSSFAGTLALGLAFGERDLGEDRLAVLRGDAGGGERVRDAAATVVRVDRVAAARAGAVPLHQPSERVPARRRVAAGESVHEERASRGALEVGERDPDRGVAHHTSGGVPAGAG